MSTSSRPFSFACRRLAAGVVAAVLSACGGGDEAEAPVAQFAVAGTVQGRTDGDVTVALNGQPLVVPAASGAFDFPSRLPVGSAYLVTIVSSPRGQQCDVLRPAGFIEGDTAVAVLCAPLRYPVSGAVSGLAGVGLRLQHGAAMVELAPGATAFVFENVAHGSAYEVRVGQHPTGQFCEVHRGTGRIDAAPVGDVVVVCTSLP